MPLLARTMRLRIADESAALRSRETDRSISGTCKSIIAAAGAEVAARRASVVARAPSQCPSESGAAAADHRFAVCYQHMVDVELSQPLESRQIPGLPPPLALITS